MLRKKLEDSCGVRKTVRSIFSLPMPPSRHTHLRHHKDRKPYMRPQEEPSHTEDIAMDVDDMADGDGQVPMDIDEVDINPLLADQHRWVFHMLVA
ncbi:hypothetical protein VKT23_015143, partial [Stygiomarasmius scandens]